MTLLYGDSTPSPLQGNFIEFLRETMDFCVRGLLAQQRITAQRERAAGLARDADATVARLDKLFAVVAESVHKVSAEEKDPALESLGAAIDHAAAELTRTEASRVRSVLSTEMTKLDVQSTAERAEIVKALAGLLVRHDLPETALRTHLRMLGGTRYGARLLGTTPFGLEIVIDLEVPSGHLFSSAVRVDRVMERLEIMVPEANGRQKDAKLRPHRFEKAYVAELAIGVTGSAVKLRDTPDGATGGYDILFGDEQRVRIMRVGDREDQSSLTEVNESDASRLRSLCERLSASAVELGKHRRGLLEATLDGQPLADHERPAVLVERLIQHIGPIVREVGARSLSPGELVLRRLLGEDRREEIFISKAELVRKLEAVPPALRGLFDPLGLERSVERRPATLPPRTQSSPTVVTTIEAELPDHSAVEKGPH